MKFSVKLDYSVVALLDLGLFGREGPVQLRHIAKRQGLSFRFLEQVMTCLKKAGLVESARGAHGGYRLAKPPEAIRVGDVLQAVEGPLALMDCMVDPHLCVSSEGIRIEDCIVREVWGEVRSSMLNALNSITLAEMCDRHHKRQERTAVQAQLAQN